MNVRSPTRSSRFYDQELLWLQAEGIRTAGSMRVAMKFADQALSASMMTRTSCKCTALSTIVFRHTLSLCEADCNAETRELYSLVPAAGCEPRVQHAQLQCNCTLQDCILTVFFSQE